MSYLSTKRVIHAGKGDLFDFKDGFKVLFDYRVELVSQQQNVDENGAIQDPACCIIDDSKLKYPDGYGKPMELIFGKKFKLAAWESCLQSMRLDEVASFILPISELMDYPFVSKQLRDISKKEMVGPDHHEHHCAPVSTCMGMAAASGGGLGYACLDEWLKNPCPLKFTFHLLQVFEPEQYERESWSLSSAEKIDSLDKLKCEGNTLFAAGLWEKAFRKYCEALTRLDSLILAEKPGEAEHTSLDKKKVVFYSNIAECKLKTGDFYAAIEACDEALQREPENVKAAFRRAKAHAGAWNFEKARADFELVLKLQPNLTKVVQKELELLVEQELAKKATEVEQYRKMFG